MKTLLHQLDQTFADVRYPGDVALGKAGAQEPASTWKRLRGKHWRHVAIKDFDSQGGMIETVSCLSLKGFIFYLPGLVRLTLTDPEPDNQYLIATALLGMFTVSDRETVEQGKDTRHQIMGALSVEQREYLGRFLKWVGKENPFHCPVVIQSAIHNLKAGQLVPYASSDVLKWAQGV